jgi:hypothetical protein
LTPRALYFQGAGDKSEELAWDEQERLIIKHFGLSRRKRNDIEEMLGAANLCHWDPAAKKIKVDTEKVKKLL